jgi:hypothetical protein
MALLDLQGLESPAPEGHGHGSALSVIVCEGVSNLSALLCGQA